jgi:hypothetical protein
LLAMLSDRSEFLKLPSIVLMTENSMNRSGLRYEDNNITVRKNLKCSPLSCKPIALKASAKAVLYRPTLRRCLWGKSWYAEVIRPFCAFPSIQNMVK